jgi:hypothetical protein
VTAVTPLTPEEASAGMDIRDTDRMAYEMGEEAGRLYSALTPEEASAAADCVAAALLDGIDPSPFVVFVMERRGGDETEHRYRDHAATEARVAAARAALVKLREVAG